ncbi:hypothetical protein [Pseudoxanthomonas indica]|uniref:Uncharacterized protein n=1 Tax=Pseudoxanthomonas indica TaxID=428993 RepID=A0A1T5LVV7_9GAMM|nr:hypothetical protein [Pseudoxanthomonas indica]GGD40676.1 hypothetical protein GCM10007235_10880 [Pseudoxanthomonas indica]SKC80136.1 hypothetical protein SAMN06296058_3219 [Pseudoxanthomonas indica]
MSLDLNLPMLASQARCVVQAAERVIDETNLHEDDARENLDNVSWLLLTAKNIIQQLEQGLDDAAIPKETQ